MYCINLTMSIRAISVGISRDGSCLFRAVVYGTCLRRGKPAPSETHQKELANELRENVVDELIKGRKYTEWYLEDEFDRYVCQMRQSHVWGGEPEHYLAPGSPTTQPDHLFVISS